MAEKERSGKRYEDTPAKPDPAGQEAVYLVDRTALLHLKEDPDGNFEYTAFDRQTKENLDSGWIVEADVQTGLDPAHDPLAAARDAAVRAAGLDGIEVSQVGLTSLKEFPKSDIYRRGIFEPETLPRDDIRFINSGYEEQFRIPNGGTIQVEYPDRTFSAKCEYIDEFHTYVGSEVYHICQFAGILERNGGVCRPEPELDAERAAWKIGGRSYLIVEYGGDHWNYHLYDERFNETKSGAVEAVGCSINQIRNRILAENKLDRRSMTPTDYGMLMEKAAPRAVSGHLRAFLESGEGSYAILQLRQTDDTLYERFASYASLQKQGKEPDASHYEAVYHGSLPNPPDAPEAVAELLESLYVRFNTDHPSDFRGHSLSVSDIVALKVGGVVSFHYVDSIGFRELKDFPLGGGCSKEESLQKRPSVRDALKALSNAEQPERRPPRKQSGREERG